MLYLFSLYVVFKVGLLGPQYLGFTNYLQVGQIELHLLFEKFCEHFVWIN